MQCPQISNEKNRSFASLTNNFLSFKKQIKKYSSMEQNLYFFHQKSEGIAFIFCRYLNQNMRAFIFCRYCPPIVLCPQIWKTKRSSKIEDNTLGILRRSFFPFNALGMPSFNNNVFQKIENLSDNQNCQDESWPYVCNKILHIFILNVKISNLFIHRSFL